MTTQGGFITDTAWIDIVDLFSLVENTTYQLQNLSNHALMIVRNATEPSALEPHNLIMPKENEIVVPKEGIAIWMRAPESINGAKAQIGITESQTSYAKESNGGLPVNVQDQTTRPIIAEFNQVQNSTIISVLAVIDTYEIELADTTGFIDGRYIILFHPDTENFSFYHQIGAPVGDIITLDTPLDFAYPMGTFVDSATTNLAVNGSVTAQIFGLRGTGAPPGVDVTVDITRVIFQCTTETIIDLIKFGDIASLIRGLVLRKRDGIIRNIFNVKTNGEIAGIMFDFLPLSKSKPNEGVDGFIARMTFAGQDKVGVALRLPIGEDLEFLVQDDLSSAQVGSQITLLEVIAEGHIVQN